MKYTFLGIFFFLLLLSGIAWISSPTPTQLQSETAIVDGKKVDFTVRQKTIVWASDDNPRRRSQIDLFNQLQKQRRPTPTAGAVIDEYKLVLDAQNSGLDKVLTQSLAGMGPDVFDSFGPQIAILHDAGLLYDVTDVLAARGIKLEQFWPVAQSALAINGRIYGLPCNVNANAMWYHKDIFDEAGVAYPPEAGWKWDDFVAVCLKLRKEENGRTTRFAIMNYMWQDIMVTNGGRYLTPDGRKCIIDSPEVADAVKKWLDLQNKYKVMPTPLEEQSMATQGGWCSGVLTLFKEKRVAMAGSGRWWLCMLRDPPNPFLFNLGAAELPVTKYRRFMGGARVAFVNATSPNRDRAVEFLTYIASKEYCDQLNREADGLPGPTAQADTEAYRYDPHQGKDASANPVWRSALKHAVMDELSPFITRGRMDDIVNNHIEIIRKGEMTPEQGLREAAKAVNEEIRLNVAREKYLKELWDKAPTTPVFGNRPYDLPDSAASSASK